MQLNSIAFIPDGNRRYALKVGIPFAEAYSLGTQRAWDVLQWIAKYPTIKTGTFYTLSLENLERKSMEKRILFRLFEKELDRVKDNDFVEKNEIRLKFMGRTELFPKKLQQKMKEAEEYTSRFSKRLINLALGYNGQAEIVDAAKKIALAVKEKKLDLGKLNPKTFENYLYTSFPNPDLIIRTSGTQRLSGFLTYQSSYSELYFSPKYWPEFGEQDLHAAIEEYNSRQRNFGK